MGFFLLDFLRGDEGLDFLDDDFLEWDDFFVLLVGFEAFGLGVFCFEIFCFEVFRIEVFLDPFEGPKILRSSFAVRGSYTHPQSRHTTWSRSLRYERLDPEHSGHNFTS